ncbi:hypothetical protein Asera_31580 [Actinocatenispora sera]|uniref:Uncharacterized protein n=1 Tax=Actinocatenispora sera TaxID=390989 RepID=A0A810L0K8_9ACTN|nr:hypothetical protein Asera_31580 [Actinocatenispora sera]
MVFESEPLSDEPQAVSPPAPATSAADRATTPRIRLRTIDSFAPRCHAASVPLAGPSGIRHEPVQVSLMLTHSSRFLNRFTWTIRRGDRVVTGVVPRVCREVPHGPRSRHQIPPTRTSNRA